MMKRREFIALVGGASAWPLAARAQQPSMPVIGFLGTDASYWNPWTTVFATRLRELGWMEGRTIAIEYRWSKGQPQSITEIIAEFIRLKVNVIVTNYSAAFAAKRATSAIPIVFVTGSDPVGSGLVASLPQPGGNITGLSLQQADIASKRLELLREVVPRLHRLAIIANAVYPDAAIEIGQIQATARALGFTVALLEIRRAEDITAAFETLNAQADALYAVEEALIVANRTRIITFALTAKLPTIFVSREFVQAGALMSYGPNYHAVFRRAADYVDKILRGAKPADIPIEQPTEFNLAINLTTAKALGLKIPESFLLRADELIE